MSNLKSFPAIILILILLTVCTTLSAQENSDTSETYENSLKKGSKSLQFRVLSNFTLGSFQGGLISFKKHFTDNSALRMGISMTISVMDNDRYESYSYTQITDLNSVQIDLSAQYLYYLNPEDKLSFFWGIGPKLGFLRSKSDEYLYDQGGMEENEHYTRRFTVGMLGSWGVEWFFRNNLSLTAEYGGGLEFHFTHQESTGDTYNTKLFKFYSRDVDFGLSVYF